MSGGSVSVEGAAQVLRPPADGLPYLRHDRAADVRLEPGDVSVIEGRIAGWTAEPDAELRIDARGCAVLPGLVDCHTHLPFAGWRAAEYEQKVTGVPYEEIARRGGGIRASARALAGASDDAVLGQARTLATEMLEHGTTAFETKSGYGLSVDAEARALGLAVRLGESVDQATRRTALLAHAVPDGWTADGWVEEIAASLPRLIDAGRPSALDLYVETIAFGLPHLERFGALAREHGLWLRAHVEQFSTLRSVPVALRAGARSVDHLACLHRDDIAPLAAAECAAVLLPGAEFLGDERAAPGRALAAAGAICVLATDCNPGTSPVTSLPLVAGLAVRRYGWSVREALLALTLNPAWVLGLSDELGSLELGKRGDLIVLDGPAESVPYRFGHNPVAVVVIDGRVVHVRPDFTERVQ